jgi:hypothetical protein
VGLTSLVVRISDPTDPTRFVDQGMAVDSGTPRAAAAAAAHVKSRGHVLHRVPRRR